MISFEGIKADPDKVSTVKNMIPPTDVSGVRRFLGLASQLAKFLANFADITNPWLELLLKKNLFHWGTAKQKAFEKIENLLAHLSVLSHCNPNHETLVAAYSFSYGLVAILMQRIEGN